MMFLVGAFLLLLFVPSGQLYASNPIVLENQKPGTPGWEITDPATAREIEGYASRNSVNLGESINFFVSTVDPSYTLEVFRTGWYGGVGARLVQTIGPFPGGSFPVPQPNADGLIVCDWPVAYTLTIPSDWTTGVYLVRLTGSSGKQNWIVFTARDDSSLAPIYFQSSVTTWQAYNDWGGRSLYTNPRAFKVSFDRPYNQFSPAFWPSHHFYLVWAYPMVRWLESQGYDIAYFTDVDTHARPQLLLGRKVYLSVGHDEYWSREMRDNVESARDAGVNLAFFSGNTAYWGIRFEPTANGNDRTVVCYKDYTIDPFFNVDNTRVTVLWRYFPLNRPEDALLGVRFGSASGDDEGTDFVALNTLHPFYRNTQLADRDRLLGLVGYETDTMESFETPTNFTLLSYSWFPDSTGKYYSISGTYTAPSGAIVFSAGSIQASFGLDNYFFCCRADPRFQQFAANIFYDMGVVPATPSVGLILEPAEPVSTPTVFTTQTPLIFKSTDGPYELGMRLTSAVDGQVVALRFWKDVLGGMSHVGNLWTADGQLLASVQFSTETEFGWQQASLSAPVSIDANTEYVVSVNSGSSYVYALDGLKDAIANGPLSSVASGSLYSGTPGTFPTLTYRDSNYFRDVVFVSTHTLTGTITPAGDGAGATVTLSGDASATTTADATGAYSFSGLSNGSYTVTPTKSGFSFTPANATVTVSGADVTGVDFTATAITGQTIFTTQAPELVNKSDGRTVNYELGTRFSSDVDGFLTGIRFWKGSSESGTHVGKIWAGDGALLTSATFNNETSSGWQAQALAAPLPISANIEYVVSVNTSNSFYVQTVSGLATAVVNRNLRTLAGGVGNGVFGAVGSMPTNSWNSSNYFRDVFFVPAQTYALSGTISPAGDGAGATLTLSGDVSATTTADAAGAYSFSDLADGSYTVTPSKTGFTFSPANAAVAVSGADVSGVDFTATAVPTFSVSGVITPAADGAGATVTLSGDTSATTTADTDGAYSFAGLPDGSYTVTPTKSGFTFTPANAAVVVSGADVSGVDFSATAATEQTIFTAQVPALVNKSDGATVNYELGARFSSDVAGLITAIRFWKGSSELGTHVGKIWAADGTLLASVTFAGRTASGWQVQPLTTPLEITANTEYVVSVNTSNTFYVQTISGLATAVVNGSLRTLTGGVGNGLFGAVGSMPTGSWSSSNYFRGVVFMPQ